MQVHHPVSLNQTTEQNETLSSKLCHIERLNAGLFMSWWFSKKAVSGVTWCVCKCMQGSFMFIR